MLDSLTLSGYRRFESYELNGLRRANLLVGKNGCGKTSILEAVELLVSGGSSSTFKRVAEWRGERVRRFVEERPDPLARNRGTSSIPRIELAHFFSGNKCEVGANFQICSQGSECKRLCVEVRPISEFEGRQWAGSFEYRLRDGGPGPVFGLRMITGDEKEKTVLPVGEDGTLLDDLYRRSTASASGAPLRFLTPGGCDPMAMSSEWDRLQAEGREAEVVESVRPLMPDIGSIHFRASHDGILVGPIDGGPRFPIGTYGDGMRRLLAIVLAFVGSEDGVLLIDEIDTGFHWTVMEDMWRLVVESARRSNVQVFATTHSYDCVRALGSLAESHPDLAEQVSIQKIQPTLNQAVSFHDDEIKVAVEQGIEVR